MNQHWIKIRIKSQAYESNHPPIHLTISFYGRNCRPKSRICPFFLSSWRSARVLTPNLNLQALQKPVPMAQLYLADSTISFWDTGVTLTTKMPWKLPVRLRNAPYKHTPLFHVGGVWRKTSHRSTTAGNPSLMVAIRKINAVCRNVFTLKSIAFQGVFVHHPVF